MTCLKHPDVVTCEVPLEMQPVVDAVLPKQHLLVSQPLNMVNFMHNPVNNKHCSGLANSNCLWSQLVVPSEFNLHTTEADVAGQLTETALCVQASFCPVDCRGELPVICHVWYHV